MIAKKNQYLSFNIALNFFYFFQVLPDYMRKISFESSKLIFQVFFIRFQFSLFPFCKDLHLNHLLTNSDRFSFKP